MKSARELFALLEKNKAPACFLLEGADPFLMARLRDWLREQEFEFSQKDLKKKGPQLEDEDLAMSTSLFTPRSFVWLQSSARPERWSAESKRVFQRMQDKADGENLFLCVQILSASSTKKSAASKAASSLPTFSFEVSHSEKGHWLKEIDLSRKAKLGSEKLRFLHAMDAELMSLDTWVELWSLGGDVWASVALGWGQVDGGDEMDQIANPAFAWVDAIQRGDSRKAHVLLNKLFSEGGEALPLLALLSKTLRIWAAVERGQYPSGQPSFLVDKVKQNLRSRSRGNQKIHHGSALLSAAAEIDLLLKSRPIDAQASLAKLTSLACV